MLFRSKILEEKWDGEKYWMKAKIDADPDEVANEIGRLRRNQQKVKELEASRKKTDDTMRDMEGLKKEIATGKDSKEKIDQYNEKVQSMKMVQGMAESFKAIQTGKQEDAMGGFINLFGTMMQNAPDK